MKIGKYVPGEVIGKSAVYELRTLPGEGGKELVVKSCLVGHESYESGALGLRREFSLLRGKELRNCARVVDFVEDEAGSHLVLERVPGRDLGHWIESGKLSMEEKLHIAVEIARGLEAIHLHRIIHKDIKPSNICYDRDARRAVIIDFGSATQLSLQEVFLNNANVLEGSLDYISPEQTGRTGNALDYRADYYSFGATLFHLFDGNVPFPDCGDNLEKIYAHLAKPVREMAGDAPQALRRVVSKCMEKEARNRYQSAYGIAWDLERIAAEPKATQLHLGTKDVPMFFRLSDKIYGREEPRAALETLMAGAFEQGRPAFVNIKGLSGIGKSSLAKSLYEYITARKAVYCSGKFDQVSRDSSFFAVKQVFSEYISQFLSFSQDEIDDLAKDLHARLGDLTDDLVRVVPAFGQILGFERKQPGREFNPQSAILALDLAMNYVGSAAHPAVFFIDDLQWADSASLDFILRTMRKPKLHLLIVGAYRSNEVDGTHPLSFMLNELRQERIAFNEIELQGLQPEHVNQLLCDTFGARAEEVDDLSKILAQKTGGNPLYVREYMTKFHNERILQYSADSHRWTWDVERIKSVAATTSAAELLTERVRMLESASLATLSVAAMFGARFDLDTLASGLRQNVVEIHKAIWPAVNEGFVNCISGEPDPSNVSSRASALGQCTYKFTHDKVQNAFLSLLAEEAERRARLAYVQSVLGFSEPSQATLRDRQTFDAVNIAQHVNRLQSQAKTFPAPFVVGVNEAAAAAAIEIGSLDKAIRFSRDATGLIDKSKGGTELQRYFRLKLIEAKGQYLKKNYDAAIACYTSLRDEPGISEYMRDHVLMQYVKVLTTVGRLKEAHEPVLDFAHRRVLKYPKLMMAPRIMWNIMVTMVGMRLTGLRSASGKPEVLVDPYQVSGSEYLKASIPTLADIHPLAILAIGFCGTKSAIFDRPGFKIVTGLAIATLNFAFAGMARYARSMVPRVRELVEQGGLTCFDTTSFVVSLAGVFAHRAKDVDPQVMERIKKAVLDGDFVYVDMVVDHTLVEVPIFIGNGLDEVIRNFRKVEDYAEFLNPTIVGTVFLGIQAQLALQQADYQVEANEGRSLLDLVKEKVPSKVYDCIERVWNDRSLFGAMQRTYAAMYYLVVGDYKKAVDEGEMRTVRQFLSSAASLSFTQTLFLTAIGYMKSRDQLTRKQRIVQGLKLPAALMFYRLMGAVVPERFAHYYDLLKAVKHAEGGRINKAMRWFRSAIKGSTDSEQKWFAGLANELAADTLIKQGESDLALKFILDSMAAYKQYGAEGKLVMQRRKFAAQLGQTAALLTQTGAAVVREATVATAKTGKTTVADPRATATKSNLDLDIQGLSKANQSIAGEVRIEGLIKSLIRVLNEVSGAERVFVIVNQDNDFVVRGSSDGSGAAAQLRSESYKTCDAISDRIVNYVLRSKTEIILGNKVDVVAHSSRTYQERHNASSLACLPVLHKDKTVALLYLETSTLENAFTSDRLQALRIITGQVAISLENASLYENLEERVRARTAELAAKTRDIQRILQHIRQGILTFTRDFKIHPEYSGHLEEILGEAKLAGKNFVDIMKERFQLPSDAMSRALAVLDSTVGEADFTWELNSGGLPSEVRYQHGAGRTTQILETSWHPMIEDDVIERVMVVVRDVTELRALETESRERKRELEVMGHILNVGGAPFEGFIKSARSYLAESRTTLSGVKGTIPRASVDLLFRNMHTIKGNARTIGFDHVTSIVHDAEQRYADLITGKATDAGGVAVFLEDVTRVEAAVGYYEEVGRKLQVSNSGASSVLEAHLEALAASSAAEVRAEEKIAFFDRVVSEYLASKNGTVASALQPLLKSVPRLATELGKEAPRVVINGDTSFDVSLSPLLADVFTHVVRNSLDHGIETAATRKQAGKTAQGTLTFDVATEGAFLVVRYRDDGGGLNLSALRRKAGPGSHTDRDLAEMIFASGVSTAEKVTDISGRGVGMDAVRSFLARAGGSIAIEFTNRDEGADKRSFSFVIKVPRTVVKAAA